MNHSIHRTSMKTILACALLAASSLFLASCDYWGEEWFKSQGGETEVAAKQTEAKNVLAYFLRGVVFQENGEKVVGGGAGCTLSDDGTLITGTFEVYEFESGAAAQAYRAKQEEKYGKANNNELVLSGNRLYAYRNYIDEGATTDLLPKVSDTFIEENGVYIQTPFTYHKSDGTGGIAGEWTNEFDGSKTVFASDGTGKNDANETFT